MSGRKIIEGLRELADKFAAARFEESCGCLWCDLDLPKRRVQGWWFHGNARCTYVPPLRSVPLHEEA